MIAAALHRTWQHSTELCLNHRQEAAESSHDRFVARVLLVPLDCTPLALAPELAVVTL